MTFSASRDAMSYRGSFAHIDTLRDFPTQSLLKTDEQIRRFELLRLAFFVLKLRKWNDEAKSTQQHAEHQLRCSLLRHVIFQQVVTLSRLDAREQALQLINTCRT